MLDKLKDRIRGLGFTRTHSAARLIAPLPPQSQAMYSTIKGFYKMANRARKCGGILYLDTRKRKLIVLGARGNLLKFITLKLKHYLFPQEEFLHSARVLEELEQSLLRERFLRDINMEGHDVDMKGYIESAANRLGKRRVCKVKVKELPDAIMDIIGGARIERDEFRGKNSLAFAVDDKALVRTFPEIGEAIRTAFRRHCIRHWCRLQAAGMPITKVLSQNEFVLFFTAFYRACINRVAKEGWMENDVYSNDAHRRAVAATLQKIQEAGLTKITGSDISRMCKRDLFRIQRAVFTPDDLRTPHFRKW